MFTIDKVIGSPAFATKDKEVKKFQDLGEALDWLTDNKDQLAPGHYQLVFWRGCKGDVLKNISIEASEELSPSISPNEEKLGETILIPGGIFWMGAQKDRPEGQNYDRDADAGKEAHQDRPRQEVGDDPQAGDEEEDQDAGDQQRHGGGQRRKARRASPRLAILARGSPRASRAPP